MASKKQTTKKSVTSVKGGRGKTVPTTKRVVPKPMTGPQKVAAKKASIAKKSKVAQAVSKPEKFAGSSKVKKAAYDAAWKKRVEASQKQSRINKIAEEAFGFTPMGMTMLGTEAAIRAITGRDLRKSPYDASGKWVGAQKGSRIGGIADAALYGLSGPAYNKLKKTKKALKAVRQAKYGYDVSKNLGKKQTAVVYNKKKALYG